MTNPEGPRRAPRKRRRRAESSEGSAKPPASTSPEAIAATLEWIVGDASPTGRRVLDVRPGSRTLLSFSEDPDAAANIAAGAIDVESIGRDLPHDPASLHVAWTFTEPELASLVAGFVPTQMEDKWLVASRRAGERTSLYFLRSWTRELLAVVELRDREAFRVWHSRTMLLPEATLRALIDGYLLGRPCVIPAPPECGDDRLRLLSFGIAVAGRRCDFVEPAASRAWLVDGRDPGMRLEFPDPCAIERQLPREVGDEAMGARFRWGLHSVFQMVVAMLAPDPKRQVERGLLPTEDAGLDHDELDLLRRWLDAIAAMDEGELRRVRQALGIEDHGDDATAAAHAVEIVFRDAPRSSWVVWGRGAPRSDRVRMPADPEERAALLQEARAADPRFGLARAGWVARFTGTGRELLDVVRADRMIRGWRHLAAAPATAP
jgi:hypothetical protein